VLVEEQRTLILILLDKHGSFIHLLLPDLLLYLLFLLMGGIIGLMLWSLPVVVAVDIIFPVVVAVGE
jgi:hypothetical protein